MGARDCLGIPRPDAGLSAGRNPAPGRRPQSGYILSRGGREPAHGRFSHRAGCPVRRPGGRDASSCDDDGSDSRRSGFDCHADVSICRVDRPRAADASLARGGDSGYGRNRQRAGRRPRAWGAGCRRCARRRPADGARNGGTGTPTADQRQTNGRPTARISCSACGCCLAWALV